MSLTVARGPEPSTATTTSADAVSVRRRQHVGKVVAGIAVLSFGVRLSLPVGVSVQFVVAALLLPVWLPALRRFVGARLLLAAGAVAVVGGIWLSTLHAADHPVDSTEAANEVVLLVGILVTIGLLVWARTILGLGLLSFLFGLGMLAAVYPVSVDFPHNPWKFGFVVPTAVILLSLSHRWNRWYLDAAVLLGLALFSVAHDSRSAFGEFLLVLVLVLVQVPLRRGRKPGSIARIVIGVGVLAVVIFEAGQALILNGFLGAATQERSLLQLETSGNLITGGRPELAATAELFTHRPAGYGVGVALNPNDLVVAKTGMSAIGYQPDNGYVDIYMFGGHIELHSVMGDLWARYGLLGVVFTAIVVVILIGGAASAVARRQASGLILFPVILSLWNLLFSPLLSSASIVELAVAVAVVPALAARRRSITDRGAIGHTPDTLRPEGNHD